MEARRTGKHTVYSGPRGNCPFSVFRRSTGTVSGLPPAGLDSITVLEGFDPHFPASALPP